MLLPCFSILNYMTSLAFVGSCGKIIELLSLINGNPLQSLSYPASKAGGSEIYISFQVGRKRNSYTWEMHLESLVRKFIQPSSAFSFHFTNCLVYFTNTFPFLHAWMSKATAEPWRLKSFPELPFVNNDPCLCKFPTSVPSRYPPWQHRDQWSSGYHIWYHIQHAPTAPVLLQLNWCASFLAGPCFTMMWFWNEIHISVNFVIDYQN